MRIHCKRGHELSEENTYTNPSGKRHCRACRRTRDREWYKATKEKCRNAARAWRKANPEKRRVSRRAAHLKHKYNMTREDYDLMAADQHHVCKICHNANPDGRRLAVDHNHETGTVRGLLCGNCNTGIGLLNEDIDRLLTVIQYLLHGGRPHE